jgi:hypothetical protein
MLAAVADVMAAASGERRDAWLEADDPAAPLSVEPAKHSSANARLIDGDDEHPAVKRVKKRNPHQR